MVRPEVIQRRLEKTEEYLDILERIRRCPLEQFLSDAEKYGSAERFLQLAIEALNDVGNHVIADMKLGVVDSTSDIPRLLRDSLGITAELEGKWVRMIGFRNILVHEYLEVDRKLVYDVLQNNLSDIRMLARAFSRFM